MAARGWVVVLPGLGLFLIIQLEIWESVQVSFEMNPVIYE